MSKTRRPLSREEIKEFKEILLKKKEELWEEIRNDLRNEVSEEYQQLINDVNDEEDLAQFDLQEEIILGILESRKKELEAISQALWRIDHNEYGKCLKCGRWICIERLKVRPQAAFCLECKEEIEKISSV